jgi:hypothetical protein
VSTLQPSKEHGGWALANIDDKCRTLLYARLWLLCAKEDSIIKMLMRKRKLTCPIANPPHANSLP